MFSVFSPCSTFSKGISCITQLLECLEDITESLDNSRDVGVIYLDYFKAFDNIPHNRLI